MENEGREGDQNNTREESREGGGNREESRRQTKPNNPKEKPQKDEEGTETETADGKTPRKRRRTDPREEKTHRKRGARQKEEKERSRKRPPQRNQKACARQGRGRSTENPKGNCLGPKGGPRHGGDRRFDRGRRAPRDQPEKQECEGQAEKRQET